MLIILCTPYISFKMIASKNFALNQDILKFMVLFSLIYVLHIFVWRNEMFALGLKGLTKISMKQPKNKCYVILVVI